MTWKPGDEAPTPRETFVSKIVLAINAVCSNAEKPAKPLQAVSQIRVKRGHLSSFSMRLLDQCDWSTGAAERVLLVAQFVPKALLSGEALGLLVCLGLLLVGTSRVPN